MSSYRFFVIFLTAFALNVCAASADVIGTTDQEVKAVSGPVLDGILEGLRTGDYNEYSRNFDGTLKDAVSEAEFKKVKANIDKTLGYCESRQYLGFLKKGKMTVTLWKGRFSKSTDDQLIKLIMTKRDGKYLVSGLWFQ